MLCKRDQNGAAQFFDHGVGLPVADAGAFLNEPRPLVDRDPAPDLPPAVMTPVAFPAQLPATQVNMELATTALVRMDMLVDPFMADLQTLLLRQPAADLLQDPVLAQQVLNRLPSPGCNPRLGSGLAAGRAKRCASARPQSHFGNVPQKDLNLVAFFLGELRVASHRCLSCLLV